MRGRSLNRNPQPVAPTDRVCQDGACVEPTDPCEFMLCETGSTCYEGECYWTYCEAECGTPCDALLPGCEGSGICDQYNTCQCDDSPPSCPSDDLCADVVYRPAPLSARTVSRTPNLFRVQPEYGRVPDGLRVHHPRIVKPWEWLVWMGFVSMIYVLSLCRPVNRMSTKPRGKSAALKAVILPTVAVTRKQEMCSAPMIAAVESVWKIHVPESNAPTARLPAMEISRCLRRSRPATRPQDYVFSLPVLHHRIAGPWG